MRIAGTGFGASCVFAAALATLTAATRADDVNYQIVVQNGQPTAGGLTLSAAIPPALISPDGQVVFNGVLHDPLQNPSLNDLSSVEVWRPDGTLKEIARQNNPAPDGGYFGPVGFVAMNGIDNVAVDAQVGASPGAQIGNYNLELWNNSATLIPLHAMGTPAPSGNGTFINTHALTLLNDSNQAAFLSAIGNNTIGPTNATGIFLVPSPGSPPTQIVATGQSVAGKSGQLFGQITPNLAFNNAGQTAFTATTVTNNPPVFSDVATTLYRSDSAGHLLSIAALGGAAPGGGTYAGIPVQQFDAPSMNSSGQVAFYAPVDAGPNVPDAIFATNTQGVASQVVRAGNAIADQQAGATLVSISAPQIDNAGQLAFRAQLGGSVTQYVSVICRANPVANGYTLSELARVGQTLPDGVGTFQDFTASPKISPNKGLVLFAASIAGAPAGAAPNNSGYFLTDGIDTVIVARTNEVFNGLPIIGMNQATANGFPIPATLNDAGQVAFFATLQLPTRFDTSELLVFTPTLSPRAGFTGSWTDPAGWTLGLAPGPSYPVAITSSVGGVVSGPSSNLTVKSLTVGTTASGTEELQLQTGVTLTVTNGLNVLPSGLLTGDGAVAGAIQNAGTISPGHSPGLISAASFAQLSTGTLHVEIAGPPTAGGPGVSFDQLDITGNANLAGTLQISLLNGYIPPLGTTFEVLTYGSLNGQFDSIDGAALGDGDYLVPVYGSNALSLVVAVPEPSAAALLLIMLVPVGLARHRQRACGLFRQYL